MTLNEAVKLVERIGNTDTRGQLFSTTHGQFSTQYDELRASSEMHSVIAVEHGADVSEEEVRGMLAQHAQELRSCAAEIESNLAIEAEEYQEALEIGDVISRGEAAWSVQRINRETGEVILQRMA